MSPFQGLETEALLTQAFGLGFAGAPPWGSTSSLRDTTSCPPQVLAQAPIMGISPEVIESKDSGLEIVLRNGQMKVHPGMCMKTKDGMWPAVGGRW